MSDIWYADTRNGSVGGADATKVQAFRIALHSGLAICHAGTDNEAFNL